MLIIKGELVNDYDNNTILVHICCSVDSHHFLTELRSLYPHARLVGYFYNPNIHPYEEYQLRLLDVERSCVMLNVELLDDEYDVAHWLGDTVGFENAPEKGERCGICFDVRLHKTAKKAKELGIMAISTTLLTSPMKPQSELFALGDSVAGQYGLAFVSLDARSKGGTQKQQKLAKDAKLYRQNYCGCLYALAIQREYSHKCPTEMFCPISFKRYLEYPIHQRLAVYSKRVELEKAQIPYRLYKKRQWFYYPFFTRLTDSNDNLIPCYTLTHSMSAHTRSFRKQKFRIEYNEHGIGHADKGEIFVLSLECFNAFGSCTYQNITQLLFSPPSLSCESNIRARIDGEYGVSMILVVERFELQQEFCVQHHAICQDEIIESILQAQNESICHSA